MHWSIWSKAWESNRRLTSSVWGTYVVYQSNRWGCRGVHLPDIEGIFASILKKDFKESHIPSCNFPIWHLLERRKVSNWCGVLEIIDKALLPCLNSSEGWSHASFFTRCQQQLSSMHLCESPYWTRLTTLCNFHMQTDQLQCRVKKHRAREHN